MFWPTSCASARPESLNRPPSWNWSKYGASSSRVMPPDRPSEQRVTPREGDGFRVRQGGLVILVVGPESLEGGVPARLEARAPVRHVVVVERVDLVDGGQGVPVDVVVDRHLDPLVLGIRFGVGLAHVQLGAELRGGAEVLSGLEADVPVARAVDAHHVALDVDVPARVLPGQRRFHEEPVGEIERLVPGRRQPPGGPDLEQVAPLGAEPVHVRLAVLEQDVVAAAGREIRSQVEPEAQVVRSPRLLLDGDDGPELPLLLLMRKSTTSKSPIV